MGPGLQGVSVRALVTATPTPKAPPALCCFRCSPRGPARPSCPAPPFRSTAHHGPRAFVGAGPSPRGSLEQGCAHPVLLCEPTPRLVHGCPPLWDSWARRCLRVRPLWALQPGADPLREGTRGRKSWPSPSPALSSAPMEQTLRKEFSHEIRGKWQATDRPSFRPPSGERCLKPSLPPASWGLGA